MSEPEVPTHAPAEGQLSQASGALAQPPPVASSSPEQTPASSPPTVRVDPSTPLFRREALDAYRRGDRLVNVLRVESRSSAILFASMVAFFVAALAVATFADVEVSSLGRGAFRPAGGVQTIAAAVPGTIQTIHVQPGETVSRGQLLFTLDAPGLRSELEQSERHLKSVEELDARELPQVTERYEKQKRLLDSREKLIAQRVRLQQSIVDRRQQTLASVRNLVGKGLVARLDELGSADEADAATRSLLELRDQLVQTRLQRSELESQFLQDTLDRQAKNRAAVANRDAAALRASQTEVRAPEDGALEALVVNEGQVVQGGQDLANLIGSSSAPRLVAFVPEKDRAFLQIDSVVHLELDRLPVGEFGTATATVARVADDLATPTEIRTALGTTLGDAAFVRVELALAQDERTQSLRRHFGSGTLFNARFALRKQRVITLVFEPLRRWLR